MKRFGYILLAAVIFLSFTAINVFAGEVDKSKQGEIEFAKAVSQDSDSDLNIDAQNVSDEELKSVVGNDLFTRVLGCYLGFPALNTWGGWTSSIPFPVPPIISKEPEEKSNDNNNNNNPNPGLEGL